MRQKIKESIKSAYKEFIDGFAKSANKKDIEDKLGHPVSEIFDSQKKFEGAVRFLKSPNSKDSGMNKALRIYFLAYDPLVKEDRQALDLLLEKVMVRRKLGNQAVNCLKLILALAEGIEQDKPVKGLLAEYAS